MHANKHILLYLLAAASLSAQPQTNQHGLRVGGSMASLVQNETTCSDLRRNVVLQSQPRGEVRLGSAVDNGPFIEFESWVEQLGIDYAESITGGCAGKQIAAKSVTIDRFVRDNFRNLYIHYAVTVELLPQNGRYRVSFADSKADLPPDIRNKTDWTIAAPPHYPVPQLAQEGDEIPVELVRYPTGVRMVDYIHVGDPQKMAKRADAPRDFYAEDADFTLGRPSLRVNGESRSAVKLPEVLRGSVIWLYVPGLGRYVASYAPHPEAGFDRAGELTGGLMTLTVDGNVLRISSHERIAPGGGVYNVYGKLDTKWTPADPRDREKFMVGTSPAVETALGK